MKTVRQIMTIAFALAVLLHLPVSASANAPGPAMDGSFQTNYITIAIFVIISVLGIGFTCAAEWLVAKYFALQKEYGKQIILTNILTQIFMRGLQLILPSVVPREVPLLVWYAASVVVLEILVVISEFLIYRRIMRNVTTKYICQYTIVANLASAIAGIVLLVIVL